MPGCTPFGQRSRVVGRRASARTTCVPDREVVLDHVELGDLARPLRRREDHPVGVEHPQVAPPASTSLSPRTPCSARYTPRGCGTLRQAARRESLCGRPPRRSMIPSWSRWPTPLDACRLPGHQQCGALRRRCRWRHQREADVVVALAQLVHRLEQLLLALEHRGADRLDLGDAQRAAVVGLVVLGVRSRPPPPAPRTCCRWPRTCRGRHVQPGPLEVVDHRPVAFRRRRRVEDHRVREHGAGAAARGRPAVLAEALHHQRGRRADPGWRGPGRLFLIEPMWWWSRISTISRLLDAGHALLPARRGRRGSRGAASGSRGRPLSRPAAAESTATAAG